MEIRRKCVCRMEIIMQNNSNLKKINADIVIAGTGVAGMYAALSLPEDKNIIMITKSPDEESDSFLAQGGYAC